MTRIPASTAREILRLRSELATPLREVAQSCGVGVATAHATLERARIAGLTWSSACGLEDAELTRRLYGPGEPGHRRRKRAPDLEQVLHARRSGKPLIESWREYRALHPEREAYSYSHFCQMLKSWVRRAGGVSRPVGVERGRHRIVGRCSRPRNTVGGDDSGF